MALAVRDTLIVAFRRDLVISAVGVADELAWRHASTMRPTAQGPTLTPQPRTIVVAARVGEGDVEERLLLKCVVGRARTSSAP